MSTLTFRDLLARRQFVPALAWPVAHSGEFRMLCAPGYTYQSWTILYHGNDYLVPAAGCRIYPSLIEAEKALYRAVVETLALGRAA